MGYVSESGRSCAWPLKEMVKPRHIINDTLDGKHLLITYCPLCKSGIVFSPIINDQRHIFKVAGLYRRNMIMIDDKTKTLWQQASGESISGKSHKSELEILFYEIMSWKGWYSEHPNTELAWEPSKKLGIRLIHKIFARIFEQPKMPKLPGRTKLGKIIDPHTEIFGIRINGKAKAYPVAAFKAQSILKDEFNGMGVELEYSPSTKSVRGFITKDGDKKPIIVEYHYWFSWKEFHPETLVHK